jgi:PPK2 family polyphosphate:nucleotide phosphotransferase
MINPENYLVNSDSQLADYSTRPQISLTEKEAKKALSKSRKKLADFQEKLFAHGKHSVLVCFQGMDTSGKDSLIREVFEKFNVRGVNQHSFKQPSSLELSHGYLWRHYIALPPKGSFGIFNRSHYENVLVTRVHPEYLLYEKLPDIDQVGDVDQDFWNMRFEQINNFEQELAQNGTYIFKFFLNLSKEEQKNRLLRRLNIPEKNWKFSAGDLKERALWDKYQHCYEQAVVRTSKDHAPWYVIPADDKPTARYIVSEILHQQLSKLDHIKFPQLDADTAGRIDEFKKILENE